MGRMWEQPIFLLIIHKLPKLDSGSGYDTPASGRIELSGPPGIIRPLRLVNIWVRGVRILTRMTVMASYLKCSVWSMDPLTMIGKKRVWHINDDNYIDLSEVVGLINGAVDNDWNNLNSPGLQPLYIAENGDYYDYSDDDNGLVMMMMMIWWWRRRQWHLATSQLA